MNRRIYGYQFTVIGSGSRTSKLTPDVYHWNEMTLAFKFLLKV